MLIEIAINRQFVVFVVSVNELREAFGCVAEPGDGVARKFRVS